MRHRRITNSGLNVHMEERDAGTVSLQQVRTVRRCQRKVGLLMDELNQVAKQIATVWMSFPPGSSTDTPLGEAVKTLDVMMLQGDQVAGWLDDWILALQAKEQATHGVHVE